MLCSTGAALDTLRTSNHLRENIPQVRQVTLLKKQFERIFHRQGRSHCSKTSLRKSSKGRTDHTVREILCSDRCFLYLGGKLNWSPNAEQCTGYGCCFCSFKQSTDSGDSFVPIWVIMSTEARFLNSEELSQIKSSPLPPQLPGPGRS